MRDGGRSVEGKRIEIGGRREGGRVRGERKIAKEIDR